METKDVLIKIDRELEVAAQDRKALLAKSHYIELQLARNTVSLEEHMRRTELLEQEIKEVKNFKWYFAGISTLSITVLEIIRRFL